MVSFSINSIYLDLFCYIFFGSIHVFLLDQFVCFFCAGKLALSIFTPFFFFVVVLFLFVVQITDHIL